LLPFGQSLTRLPPNPLSLPEKPPPPTARPPAVPIINVSAEDDTFRKKNVGEEEPVVSREQEQRAGRILLIKGQHDREHQRRKRKDSSPLRSAGSGASTPVSAGEEGAQLSTMKRLKTGTDEETPSLLLRMGHHPRRVSPVAGSRNTSRLKSRSTSDVQSQRRRRSNSPRRRGSDAAGLPDLSLGISIKGAARSHSHSHSLLERIQGNGT